jgi:hypothetical protein
MSLTGMMRITLEMIEAARRAEFDYFQRGRLIGSARFIPTPDEVIKVMLAAAFALVPDQTAAPGPAAAIAAVATKPAAIVTASRPHKRR